MDENKTPAEPEVKVPETTEPPQTTDTQIPPTDIDPEAGKGDPIIDGHYMTNPFFHEVANYFGVEVKDFDVAKNKLADIVDYVVKEHNTKLPEDILSHIRELEDKVVPPQWGETRYSNLHKYVRLALHDQATRQAMKTLERRFK